ncbi:putative ribonuclease H-like domain-containing protein [Tanacetum coccineum]
MRNKLDIDKIDIDDLYNNLRVYEDEMKRSSSSTSTSQNLVFLSSENTSSTNEVSTASGDFRVSTASGISQVSSTPYAHDVACSFFAQPTTSPQLENEDFQQIDEDDLEELDLRWQVAILTVRCYNCHRKGHFARECRSGRNQGKRSYGDNGRSNAPTNESSSQALVAQDGLGGYDWSNDFEIEPVNYALMAISSSSSSSSSDNEVQKCSKQCLESFKTLQKNYDSEREKHSRARLEIQGYELALESLESRILVHEKNELAWGEKYEFQNYELKCREIKINNLNLELEKVVKERDELKLKIEKWEESSKNLDELLNSQMSARDKTGLGYGTQLNEMSNNSETDSEISLSVFDVRSSDEESTPANDRFSKADGYHAVPPPITGNFLTPRADISFAGLDEYAIRKKIIESKTTDLNTKTSETVGKTNEANTQKPKTVYESVNRDKVIIEDWNSDDEDDVSEVQTVSPVKTNETQTVKTRVDKIDQTSQKQGIGFKKIKACFVCKSTDHLIKDCNFHDKKSQEPKLKTMVNTGPRVDKPVWDNTKRGNPEICFRIPIWQCFKLLDESQVVLRAPRKDDVYSLDLKNIVPSGGITCLYANAIADESKLWHRRLGHVNFKNINKLVKGHLVRGLPSKVFVNDHTCVAYKKGKQHKASCKAKLERIIRKPLELLYMDLFGPVSIESINKKRYCLVVTDDFSRFSWVFFLATKDETSEILCKFTIVLENLLNHNVKIIRCDNRTEFKNHAMNEFCAKKGIKREFSVARTLQHNGVGKRKNKTLIEAARTMLADLLLPILFWAEAVNTACYIPWANLMGNLMKVICLDTLPLVNPLKYTTKGPKGSPQKKIKNLLRNTYYFHYTLIGQEEQHTLTEAEQALKDDLEKMIAQEIAGKAIDDATRQAFEEEKKKAAQATSINKLNTGRPSVSTSNSPLVSTANTPYASAASTPTGANTDDSNVFTNDGIFSRAYDDEDVHAEVDFNNMDNTIDVNPIPTPRIHKDHPKALGEAMQVELLQFKLYKVWILVDLPFGKKEIGTKWVFRNKRDERSIIVKNKARLVAQGFRQEEGIDYDEVFAPVARIEAIRLFLAFASFMGFHVCQMDVKSAFLYETIEEEVYVHQPPGFVDPTHPNKFYKVIKALYDLH